MKRLLLKILLPLALCFAGMTFVDAQPKSKKSTTIKTGDIKSIQTLLAIGALDAWLLADSKGKNRVAYAIVKPVGKTSYDWFYIIPQRGDPTLISFHVEQAAFAHVRGKKLIYSNDVELTRALKNTLDGLSIVAAEYAPQSGVPQLTQVDEALATRIREFDITLQSSAGLVQQTQSRWGTKGRVSHYVAAHHLSEISEDTFTYIGEKFREGQRLTELDIQSYVLKQFQLRGLNGQPPIIAFGPNTSQPDYRNQPLTNRVLAEGDLIVLDLFASELGAERGIIATQSWIGYLGDSIPPRYKRAFSSIVAAREFAIKWLKDRIKRRRAIKGFEVDRVVRNLLDKGEWAGHFKHRTGHSIDTEKIGSGAHLDDYQTKDVRNLVVDSGFTLGPGLYWPGDFGIRSVVSVYMARRGIEITSKPQFQIRLISPR